MHVMRARGDPTTSRSSVVRECDLEILQSGHVIDWLCGYIIFCTLVFFQLSLDLFSLIGILVRIDATTWNKDPHLRVWE
jgi:hypothetical protein